MHFWNNLRRYAGSHKIWNPNNFKIYGSKKTKVIKDDSHNQLMSPTHEGGEAEF